MPGASASPPPPPPPSSATKPAKAKATSHTTSQNATPSYGCDHIKALFEIKRDTAINHYAEILENVRNWHNINARCTRCHEPKPVVRYCLQCSNVSCVDDPPHGSKANANDIHSWGVNSRTGQVYCYLCQDYIYDSTLEQMRLSAIDAPGSRKRKFEEYKPSPEETKVMDTNTNMVSCKATSLRGLYNMGSTCFISVIMQSLIHNPIMRNWYLADGHKSNECEPESGPCMNCAVHEVFTEFYKEDSTNPYAATNLLNSSWSCGKALAGKEQHDAGEYLLFMLQQLCESHEGEAQEQCKCIIHQCFYGTLQTDRQCRGCHSDTDSRFDTELGIQLPLRTPKDAKKLAESSPPPQNLSLQTCLDAYTMKETLKLFCHSCGQKDQEFSSRCTFKRLPNVLSITLKRFSQVKGTENQYKKNEARVKFPLTLDMTPYTPQTKRRKHDTTVYSKQSFIYDLFTAVVHIGKIDTGHYINYSRSNGNV